MNSHQKTRLENKQVEEEYNYVSLTYEVIARSSSMLQ